MHIGRFSKSSKLQKLILHILFNRDTTVIYLRLEDFEEIKLELQKMNPYVTLGECDKMPSGTFKLMGKTISKNKVIDTDKKIVFILDEPSDLF